MEDKLNDVIVQQTTIPQCDPITVSPCEICKKVDLASVDVTDGFQLTIGATVTNVCKGKTVAIGCILCEVVEEDGQTVNKIVSTQVVTKTADGTDACQTLTNDFIFVFPATCGDPSRTFKAKIVANYLLTTECTCPCS